MANGSNGGGGKSGKAGKGKGSAAKRRSGMRRKESVKEGDARRAATGNPF